MRGSGNNLARIDLVFGPGDSEEPGFDAGADLVVDAELAQDLTVADGDLPGVDTTLAENAAADHPVTPAPVTPVAPARGKGLLSRLGNPRMTPAVTLSFAAHVVLAAVFLPSVAEEMQIAGGEEVNVTIIGAEFLDALRAGENVEQVETTEEVAETSETLKPVETASLQPVEESVVEPVEQPETKPVESVVSEPVPEPAPVVPQETPAEPVEPVTAGAAPVPAVQELAALPDQMEDVVAPVSEPVETATPVEEVPEIANVPIPQPRPEPPKTEVAKLETPEPERPKVRPKPAQQAEAPARKESKAAEKPRAKPAAGDSGTQAATTSKGSSGARTDGKSNQAGNAAVSNYPGKVASKLKRALRYPKEARSGKLRGEVLVSFVVASNGSVSSVRVARSSGSPILDQAAGDAVRRAAPFPPIPEGAGRSNWSFSVPLAFTR